MVTVDELIQRLDDSEATFMRDEVTKLIDWYVAAATDKDIHAMRIEVERESRNAIIDANQKALTKLLDSWDTTPTVPTLQVIKYE